MSVTDDAGLPIHPAHGEKGAALRVLASGSAGNCSVIVLIDATVRRIILVDLGLSPRRTFALLAQMGLGPHQLDHALVTHFDQDHFHPGWATRLPAHARLHVHQSHATRAYARGCVPSLIRHFDGPVELEPGVRMSPILLSHDDEGVAAFRFDLRSDAGEGALGFATDLGHAPPALLNHFQGVDVLAIESNYCPRMQKASDRPDFLKDRIMGGRGHLSNQQSAKVVHTLAEDGTLQHVVLLHLSRQCNDPGVALEPHAGADYAVTIADQHRPTRWITLAPIPRPAASPPRITTRPAATLWDAMTSTSTAPAR